MHSSATENDEKLSHLANERIHKISGIFFGFFSFLSDNLTWNGKSKLKFVLGSLSSSPGRHIKWSKVELTHKKNFDAETLLDGHRGNERENKMMIGPC